MSCMTHDGPTPPIGQPIRTARETVVRPRHPGRQAIRQKYRPRRIPSKYGEFATKARICLKRLRGARVERCPLGVRPRTGTVKWERNPASRRCSKCGKFAAPPPKKGNGGADGVSPE